MKFIKSFKGCRKGEVFPTDFKPGEECPKELEFAAKEAGAIGGGNKKARDGEVGQSENTELKAMTVEQLKALAAEKGYDLGDASKKDDIIAAIELASEQ